MPKNELDDKNRYLLEDDPLWFKDAIIYELHVKAFLDSSGDGIGDFQGLAQKLDYLQDLGITAVWLLPFSPSPLKDDGYDTADYTDVHPLYGNLADFKLFLKEAHRRGLRVITELVLNHTSDQHPWFQRARRAPKGSAHRNWYVWSDTGTEYKETRIIFQDFETSNWTWDPVAQQYFWHRFYSHQPDLNWANPDVRKHMYGVLDFWFGLGVDGLRLDAVPYLYEREGTNCENLPETHQVLQELRAHVDSRWSNRMLLAEANQWPEDAVAYFGKGDECHMAFHFPVMPRMFMANRMENRFPIIDIMEQTPAIPENCQWAMFLRNHDELTLEMVTDEERDYMYRAYAHDPQMRINLGIRRRLAPLLGNDRNKIELMNGLLFSFPGTPVIYYGDEIGMGDNIYLGDRDGVRTPMQWSADRNAGFSRANPQRLYLPITSTPEYHYETVNVEAQQNNPNSLLWWMKQLIALRKQSKAFGRGSLEFLFPENRKVLAFIRRFGDEVILVVANLSRLPQPVELDLSRFKGLLPVEMQGATEFPLIDERPYVLTLPGYAFYYFSLQRQRLQAGDATGAADERRLPMLSVSGEWTTLFSREHRRALERILPDYLRTRRWFGGKARTMTGTHIADAVAVETSGLECFITFVEIRYTEGDPDMYVLPLVFAWGEHSNRVRREVSNVIVAQLRGEALLGRGQTTDAILYDGFYDPKFRAALLDAIIKRRRFIGSSGEITASPRAALRDFLAQKQIPESTVVRAEQSNTSIIYGEKVILKMFRHVEAGMNPDLELGLFLTERVDFPHTSRVAGAIEYRHQSGVNLTLGILHGFVPNEGDAWQYTLDQLSVYFQRALARRGEQPPEGGHGPLLDTMFEPIPPMASALTSAYLESARLLGQRTAEMHLALSADRDDRNFAPEEFTTLYQRSLYQAMRNLTREVMLILRRRQRLLPQQFHAKAQAVLQQEGEILRRFRSIADRKLDAWRMRIHGDYHLGQVLYTGKDFVIIDFEGEPAHALTARRIKRSPLRDVAGMLRSFHYATATALSRSGGAVMVRPEDLPALDLWARAWQRWVSGVYLRQYLETMAGSYLLPRKRDDLQLMLNIYLLEKAVYELGYEMNSRPDWVGIPLDGLLQTMEQMK